MWKLDGTRGTLETPELAARLDLGQPHHGLQVTAIRHAGQIAAFSNHRILQVHFPDEPSAEDVQDSWVRGADLVVTYAHRKGRQVTAEIYWRLVQSCVNAIGVEMILSVQTDLLDAKPTMSASSEIKSDEFLWLGDHQSPQSLTHAKQTHRRHHAPRDEFVTRSVPSTIDRTEGSGVFLYRFTNSSFSYVDMVHPTDFCSATVENKDGSSFVHWQLFPDSLEKGVIRRARLRGLFVDRNNDLKLAGECYQEFVNSALPLTT